MLALEIIAVLGAAYAALVAVAVWTQAGRHGVQFKRISPAGTGGAW
jgi:hypothetical protein